MKYRITIICNPSDSRWGFSQIDEEYPDPAEADAQIAKLISHPEILVELVDGADVMVERFPEEK